MIDRVKPWRNRIVGYGEEDPAALKAHPQNWRKHPRAQHRAIRAILGNVGIVQNVITNVRTGRLLDGHLRLEEALLNGETAIPVTYVDLSEDEEALILATLDPIGALATANEIELARLLGEIETDDTEIQDLLSHVAKDCGAALAMVSSGETDPDEVPASLDRAVSREGDLWLMGDHRVLGGDATNDEHVSRLFDGALAQALWSDPPYGVEYEGGTAEHLRIRNDGVADLEALLRNAFTLANEYLDSGSAIYVAHPTGPNALIFANAFFGAGWHLHQDLVWVKDTFVLGHSDYQQRHEGIYYGWKGKRQSWFGGRDASSVFEIPRPRRSTEHPTMKPVALVEAHLHNSCAIGGLVYDPFCGSGTTLIAATRLRRRCVAMELASTYVDVAVRRWQAYTGQPAILDGDGRSFAEIEAVRRGR